jgi:putative cell wall-binding protein
LVSNVLLPAQKEYLESVNSKTSGNIYVIGGSGAVNESVLNSVFTYARGEKERLFGATRYTTSTAVANKFFQGTRDSIVLAYAMNYPDGLSGGRIANEKGAPLVLVIEGKCASAKEYVSNHGVNKCIVLGGSTLVTEKALRSL